MSNLSVSESPSKRSLLLSDASCTAASQETPTEKDAADDIAGHLRVLWQKVDLMRRLPVDEEDDASDDSDASDADSSEEEAADDHAAADAADAEQLLARIEAVEDEVLVLKTRAAGSDSYPPVRFPERRLHPEVICAVSVHSSEAHAAHQQVACLHLPGHLPRTDAN